MTIVKVILIKASGLAAYRELVKRQIKRLCWFQPLNQRTVGPYWREWEVMKRRRFWLKRAAFRRVIWIYFETFKMLHFVCIRRENAWKRSYKAEVFEMPQSFSLKLKRCLNISKATRPDTLSKHQRWQAKEELMKWSGFQFWKSFKFNRNRHSGWADSNGTELVQSFGVRLTKFSNFF